MPKQPKRIEKIPQPKTLQKIPPITAQKQPKQLSAIPKGHEGTAEKKAEETKPSAGLKYDKNFSKMETEKKATNIFDKDIIAKYSSKNHESAKVETSHGLSFSAKEFNDWGYLERLKEKIERVWQYPPQAAERGIYGDLYIRFTIDKKGKLVSVELLRTSGYRMLDDAAIKALKDAQPFWPLPDDWQKESLTITGHFIYTLRGFYLR
ncbi:energy transducer TonB [Thermodesulfovibrio hydrogeniphilus]